jgi:hypothetical protein
MLALRCTQKLLKRVGKPDPDPPQSTTVLGDWFAQPLSVGHQRFVLLASELSRLPILMPARDVKNIGRNFPHALGQMLWRLDIPAGKIERGVDAAREVVIAATNNRSVLGTLNDYSNMLQWTMPNRPNTDLVDVALWLSHTPVRPIDGFPDNVTRALLGESKPSLRLLRGGLSKVPNHDAGSRH